jgi:CRISPR-associated protein Csh2
VKITNQENAKRSEFLFCYDVRMANPNGDPDENRPRKDPSGKNLVTEFRLKRTIRDYLSRQLSEPIFIREEMDENGMRKTVEDLASPYISENKKKKTIRQEDLIRGHIDIRLFGLLFAVQDIHFKRVGPVQFAIGCSLNKIEELPIRITRVIPTKEEAKAGTFGEKSVVRYSFIVFHGFLNNFVAEEVNTSEEDVAKMMKGMWFGTNDLSTTSKFGQISRLLLRVVYSGATSFIGDLDRYIFLEKAQDNVDLEKLEGISQTILNVNQLLNTLERNKKNIECIECAFNDDLKVKYADKIGVAQEIFQRWSEEKGIRLVSLQNLWSSVDKVLT